MQTSLTVALERNATIAEVFHTEPYEAGWAREVRWFIHVFAIDEYTTAEFATEISPDGLHWCDLEDVTTLAITEPGLYSIPVSNFGHWLRLRGCVSGKLEPATARAHIHLVCKS